MIEITMLVHPARGSGADGPGHSPAFAGCRQVGAAPDQRRGGRAFAAAYGFPPWLPTLRPRPSPEIRQALRSGLGPGVVPRPGEGSSRAMSSLSRSDGPGCPRPCAARHRLPRAAGDRGSLGVAGRSLRGATIERPLNRA